jgi:hypothetical protein
MIIKVKLKFNFKAKRFKMCPKMSVHMSILYILCIKSIEEYCIQFIHTMYVHVNLSFDSYHINKIKFYLIAISKVHKLRVRGYFGVAFEEEIHRR